MFRRVLSKVLIFSGKMKGVYIMKQLKASRHKEAVADFARIIEKVAFEGYLYRKSGQLEIGTEFLVLYGDLLDYFSAQYEIDEKTAIALEAAHRQGYERAIQHLSQKGMLS